ncbi:pteridine reductase [Shewanella violacea]|uniref:Pteridine reductase n=1 Tax=Shewanella violacea (strain JCM 10179 / CIP 106290 / LMG 19151 / DSS12) TaxID=637905 RepID=D4ZKS7_SHEVD|nr:pteridine reductase [Shewanella violacea]BAJ02276.1 pteridine reductase [Shewanella violacea DSS12]
MQQWALVTGAAKRIGREIAIKLHSSGYNVIIHYATSADLAQSLCNELNQIRENSCVTVQAYLSTEEGINKLVKAAAKETLSIVINNASEFYRTPLNDTQFKDSQHLLTVNLLAPYYIAQKLYPTLRENKGIIINLLDIHGQKPLKEHGLYSISKAALQMATLSLAQEMGPDVRVNGIAPGAILWPENSHCDAQESIIKQIPLAKCGSPADIANTVQFLVDSPYISGQIIAIDGGRTATGYQGA